ncbi:MAG: DUF3795 domain-containing protein [Pseudomonadota bacterium]
MSQPPRDAHIAACGLFCTNCGKFEKGRCPGCQIQPGFSRCAVRACCVEQGILNCGACPQFAARDYKECKKLFNFIARLISTFTGSDRLGALVMLRDRGTEAFVADRRSSGKM